VNPDFNRMLGCLAMVIACNAGVVIVGPFPAVMLLLVIQGVFFVALVVFGIRAVREARRGPVA
jgi:hypothetical protein